jgi:hypothetical protein
MKNVENAGRNIAKASDANIIMGVVRKKIA